MNVIQQRIPSRWPIFEELSDWNEDFNRFFTDLGRRERSLRYPPVNAWTNDNEAIVDVEIPGIDPQKVELTINNDELTVAGNRETDQPAGSAAYQTKERIAGPFTRTLKLPFRVNTENVDAKYRNGVLRIRVARAEEDKPKQIRIEAA